MPEDGFDETEAFARMAREFPVRTCIFSFGLPAFALVQLVNGLVNGGSVAYIALFGLLAVGCSVLLTRYHVAVYRRRRVERWTDEPPLRST